MQLSVESQRQIFKAPYKMDLLRHHHKLGYLLSTRPAAPCSLQLPLGKGTGQIFWCLWLLFYS